MGDCPEDVETDALDLSEISLGDLLRFDMTCPPPVLLRLTREENHLPDPLYGGSGD